MSADEHALTLSCRNRPGIVAAISQCLFENGADIHEAHQFDDAETGVFFARIGFGFVGSPNVDRLRSTFSEIAKSFSMTWKIRAISDRMRVLLLASRFDHCLVDLLYRWRAGELPMEVTGIVSNYARDTYRYHDFEGVPFDHLPITKDNKPQQEAEISRIVQERNIDLVVLARYMQVLSEDLASKLSGRCINIHHSFLPGFKGAKSYYQAHSRGVKLIGATAHYVTSDLDEGQIIEQDVERVSHHDTAEALVRNGRDIERRVLSRAVAWHLDSRVILNGRKTVVFRD